MKHDEVTGPEAEAAIAQITQQPPDKPQEGSTLPPHASKPTTSALAEHDAAFPAIGAMNGIAGPGKHAATMNGSASVVVTVGDDAPGTLDTALETAASSVSVCLTVGDEGEDVLVALTLDGADRYVISVRALHLPLALPLPCPAPALPCLWSSLQTSPVLSCLSSHCSLSYAVLDSKRQGTVHDVCGNAIVQLYA